MNKTVYIGEDEFASLANRSDVHRSAMSGQASVDEPLTGMCGDVDGK